MTAEGEMLPIKDMTTSHIQNCMRMIERMCQAEDSSLACASSMFSGDSMASYYAEREADSIMAQTIEERFPKYEELEKELSRRAKP